MGCRDKLLGEISSILDFSQNQKLLESHDLKKDPMWDSISIANTIVEIEDIYGVILDSCDIYSCQTVRDIFSLIDEKKC